MAAADLSTRLRRFLACAPQNVRSVVVAEISHSAFSRTWWLWRERQAKVVTLDTGAAVEVLCTNIEFKLAASDGTLNQRFDVAIDTVDKADTFRRELKAIPVDSDEPAVLVYREYLSDDLTFPEAVVHLQVETCSYQRGAATLVATSPRYDLNRTGEIYSRRDIPMLGIS
ncbi:DUF1833 domain-containing protein [Xylophilus sp. Kf1]|nr:DUF1833 domain-containing protein [Xylophilus sp. Kf1]